jgi:pre-mRNA-splicing factor 38B
MPTIQEVDLKAGGGFSVTVGEMCRMMISKLDWFGTLFPRLPVHVQKDLEVKLKAVQVATRLVQTVKCRRGGLVVSC